MRSSCWRATRLFFVHRRSRRADQTLSINNYHASIRLIVLGRALHPDYQQLCVVGRPLAAKPCADSAGLGLRLMVALGSCFLSSIQILVYVSQYCIVHGGGLTQTLHYMGSSPAISKTFSPAARRDAVSLDAYGDWQRKIGTPLGHLTLASRNPRRDATAPTAWINWPRRGSYVLTAFRRKRERSQPTSNWRGRGSKHSETCEGGSMKMRVRANTDGAMTPGEPSVFHDLGFDDAAGRCSQCARNLWPSCASTSRSRDGPDDAGQGNSASTSSSIDTDEEARGGPLRTSARTCFCIGGARRTATEIEPGSVANRSICQRHPMGVTVMTVGLLPPNPTPVSVEPAIDISSQSWQALRVECVPRSSGRHSGYLQSGARGPE
jgi:hypothetical protein